MLVEVNDQVQWIRLHRPKAYNAMNFASYRAVMAALDSAAENDLVKMTVVTGTGPFFSSGKDLSKAFRTTFKKLRYHKTLFHYQTATKINLKRS